MNSIDLTQPEIVAKQDVLSLLAPDVHTILTRDFRLGLRPVKSVKDSIRDHLKSIPS